ncbi:MAG: alpha/beta fold hydrolase [Gemmatimonadetes bacterium]|nr:alpha/beta fold hydrolase [Gemmatimonadota bacterium]
MHTSNPFRRVVSNLVPGLTVLFVLASPVAAQRGRMMEGQTLHSEALGSEWEYSVYLPPGYDAEARSYLTVYLLHGYGGNHTDWVRLGDAATTADSLIGVGAIPPVILIMPDGRNSFYVDSDPEGGAGAYETAIIQDLISHVDDRYRTIPTRRGKVIAGLSMGGYGAMHLAFKYPERFLAAASLSGVVGSTPPDEEDLGYFRTSFGDPFDFEAWRAENPHNWIPSLKENRLRVPVFLTIGDDDGAWLYEGTVELYTALKESELPAELRITNGAHSWEVWDRSLRQTLLFFSRVFRARYR